MTQSKKGDKVAELNSVFLTLDEATQEYALTLLQALRFGQTKYRPDTGEDVQKPATS